jgi:hypothetical protein
MIVAPLTLHLYGWALIVVDANSRGKMVSNIRGEIMDSAPPELNCQENMDERFEFIPNHLRDYALGLEASIDALRAERETKRQQSKR